MHYIVPEPRDITDNHLKDEYKTNKKNRIRFIIVIGSVAVVIIVLVGVFYMFRSNKPVIPKRISQAVSFPLYYPSEPPKGYSLKKDSFSLQNNIVFYSLKDHDGIINISEQSVPNQPPDLANIQGFKKLNTETGDAVIGLNSGQPIAIFLTNTTLVNVSGTGKVPQDTIAQTVQKMISQAD